VYDMVWNQLAGIKTPPIITTDFLYIRFIEGDHTRKRFWQDTKR